MSKREDSWRINNLAKLDIEMAGVYSRLPLIVYSDSSTLSVKIRERCTKIGKIISKISSLDRISMVNDLLLRSDAFLFEQFIFLANTPNKSGVHYACFFIHPNRNKYWVDNITIDNAASNLDLFVSTVVHHENGSIAFIRYGVNLENRKEFLIADRLEVTGDIVGFDLLDPDVEADDVADVADALRDEMLALLVLHIAQLEVCNELDLYPIEKKGKSSNHRPHLAHDK